VSFVCAVPSNMDEANCSMNPVQVSGASTTDAIVTVATSAPHPLLTGMHSGLHVTACWLSVLCAVCFGFVAVRRKRSGAGAPLMVAAIALIAGCGGGSSSPPRINFSAGTPPGNYILTITATSGTASHQYNLNVVVQ
jgi:hypothetical protein